MDFKILYKEFKEKNDPIKMENLMNEINNFFETKMNEKFDKVFGEYKTQVYDIFEKTNCIISGSIIPQILLNEEWSFSDIDIFYFDKDCKNVYDAMYFPDNKIITIIDNFDFKLVNQPSCIYQTLFDFNNDHSFTVMTNTGIEINGETIQFICICYPEVCTESDGNIVSYNQYNHFNPFLDELDVVKYENKDKRPINYGTGYMELINLLTANFDYDICKNFVRFENGKMICHFNNIDAILTKTFSCNIIYERKYELDALFNNNSRKLKYLKRGFTFAGYEK